MCGRIMHLVVEGELGVGEERVAGGGAHYCSSLSTDGKVAGERRAREDVRDRDCAEDHRSPEDVPCAELVGSSTLLSTPSAKPGGESEGPRRAGSSSAHSREVRVQEAEVCANRRTARRCSRGCW